jgi:protoporphyrinogen oxidase
MSATHCAVVGGGMLGMSVALQLARNGFDVTIYEQAPQLGGLAAPWTLGEVCWDRHYHVILRSDTRLRRLLDELGLDSAVEWKTARSAFYIDGALHPFTNALDHLRFPALTFSEKIRLARTVARAKHERNWALLEAVSIETWLRGMSGDRVFERIWRPLLRAKLGDAYTSVSAAFIWATINRLCGNEADRCGPSFGYVRNGYSVVIERLSALLRRQGVRLRVATGVSAIRAHGWGIAVSTSDETEDYDRVIVTTPTPIAARVCDALCQEERDRLQAIRYQGVVCASLLLDQPLGKAYVTNIADDSIPFTAVVEMTNLVNPATFGGRHLVYLPRYVRADDPLYARGDAVVRSDALSALHRMYPRFAPSQLRAFRVSRVPYVFALPTIGYSGRLPGFGTSQRGLYVATSAQIVNGTLNVNETLELAARAARHVLRDPHFSRLGWHEAAS